MSNRDGSGEKILIPNGKREHFTRSGDGSPPFNLPWIKGYGDEPSPPCTIKKPPASGGRLFCVEGWVLLGLDALDVLGLGSLVTADDFEADFFALVEGFEAGTEDARVMHEYILTGVLGNETEPFFVIEPFDFTARHMCLLRCLSVRA